ncbi:hypothetical protein VNO77_00311 [Canavalia gladiata]|uniref:Uncharacterized protein n=1 Tax=Canavalia gladiata TaxID=3824 RepID=A0AAN9R570_CANGL
MAAFREKQKLARQEREKTTEGDEAWTIERCVLLSMWNCPHLVHVVLPAIAFHLLMEYYSSCGPLQFIANIIYGVICNLMIRKKNSNLPSFS